MTLPSLPAPKDDVRAAFTELGVEFPEKVVTGRAIRSPIDGSEIARVADADPGDVREAVGRAAIAFQQWRETPAPLRGELVRLLSVELRAGKRALGRVITIEAGKVLSEGLGEVQEMIDVCDFAVGLSRQVGGRTMPSERPGHRMMETWHPLGPVAIISAFNFPAAVWSWNAALALVCGDPCVWKPSEKTPLTALAIQGLFARAATRFAETTGHPAPEGLSTLVLGDKGVGGALADDRRVPLISATGSCRMGAELAPRAAKRFARTILELGGNNAAILAPSADIGLAVRGAVFSAVGTAGQRCTSLRRLFVHESVYGDVISRLKDAYASVAVGDPRSTKTLVGPLIDGLAMEKMQNVLASARQMGVPVAGGEPMKIEGLEKGQYARPAIVEMAEQTGPMLEETFAPILYVMQYANLDEAVSLQNDVEQGLSSSIFTTDLREAERFLSASGSDCGIANVNIGTSGAEIGGAFGGEKATGGGRESGSDSWKTYMRRATNTINYSPDLPLAQGVEFDV
ncbi:MAG: aldehyde dehydrogenase family protein [Alphaproteobacteria bacterium]|nr:aldehyde dehydrogenase family protein [Alphaproteobacteria bacterium]